MPVQSLDLSTVTDATFNGSAVEQINLNGASIWTMPVTAPTNTHVVRLANPAGGVNTEFGMGLAMSEDYILAGADGDTALDTAFAGLTGAVYLFNHTGTLLQSIKNPDPHSNDRFGQSVAIYNNIMVIGAPRNLDVEGGPAKGAVYIYNTSGTLLHTLSPPSSVDNGDMYGWRVAIHTNTIVVGTPDAALSMGRVHIYNTSGTLLHTLSPPNSGSFLKFGYSVAISSTKIVVGANQAGTNDSGEVYVYNHSGALLATLNTPTDSAITTNQNFGDSIAIYDDYIVIGMKHWDLAIGNEEVGRAYIYNTSGTLLHVLSNPDEATALQDHFGNSVAINGDYIVIGALDRNGGVIKSGRAYVFDTSGNYLFYLTPAQVGASDRLGTSVAINGRTIAVCTNSEVSPYANEFVDIYN